MYNYSMPQAHMNDYNTQKPIITLPEYGRTIQRLVKFATNLPTKEERTHCAYAIIDIMGNLFPYLRDSEDYKHKLWDHLAIMSDFKLDIDYPYTPLGQENLRTKPHSISYPVSMIEERHYGNSIMLMIAKAVELNEGEERAAMLHMIANHMKKCYLLWNNGTVDDNKIIDDICRLAKGKIKPEEITFKLTETRSIFEIKKKINGKQNMQSNQNNKQRQFQRNGSFKK